MSRQFFSETIGWQTQDGTALANSTTETQLNQDVVIPSNYLSDGRLLRVRAFGKLSVTGTPTIQFAIRLGGAAGTLLAQTETITNGSGLTNVNWSIEVVLQVRTNGSSGTVIAMGEANVQTNASGDPTVKTNVFGVSGSDAPAAATINALADAVLALTGKWSAQSASNTTTCLIFLVESLN